MNRRGSNCGDKYGYCRWGCVERIGVFLCIARASLRTTLQSTTARTDIDLSIRTHRVNGRHRIGAPQLIVRSPANTPLGFIARLNLMNGSRIWGSRDLDARFLWENVQTPYAEVSPRSVNVADDAKLERLGERAMKQVTDEQLSVFSTWRPGVQSKRSRVSASSAKYSAAIDMIRSLKSYFGEWSEKL